MDVFCLIFKEVEFFFGRCLKQHLKILFEEFLEILCSRCNLISFTWGMCL